MKKIFLTTLLLLSFLSNSFAQLNYRLMNMHHTSDYEDDTQINEGDVIVFNTFEYEPAKLGFLTYNDSDSDIKLQVVCEGLTNTDGAGMELCYGGFCYYGIDSFVPYPTNPFAIQPGQHQGILLDYFSNTDGSSDIVQYDFRFFQIDDEGFEIPNSSINFIYKYDANVMGVSDISSVAIAEVFPTVITNNTNVNLKEKAFAQVLNLNGQIFKNLDLNPGKSTIDFSGFSAGVYLIKFKGVSGLTTTKKVVVK